MYLRMLRIGFYGCVYLIARLCHLTARHHPHHPRTHIMLCPSVTAQISQRAAAATATQERPRRSRKEAQTDPKLRRGPGEAQHRPGESQTSPRLRRGTGKAQEKPRRSPRPRRGPGEAQERPSQRSPERPKEAQRSPKRPRKRPTRWGGTCDSNGC